MALAVAACCAACTHSKPRVEIAVRHAEPRIRAAASSERAANPGTRERFETDTTRVSAGGVRYTVPAGWTLTTRDRIAIVTAPEGDLQLAIIDSDQAQLDAAISEAWKRYGQEPPSRKHAVDGVTGGGWDRARGYVYELSADEKRVVVAEFRSHGDSRTVLLLDAADATREKRGGQFALLDQSVQPANHARESFAGKTAQVLNSERLQQLDAFIERGRVELDIPGVAIAIAQSGRVVHARGYGVRELGKSAPVSPKTLFRVASITKPLTSLLLARLVDAGNLRWEQPVVEVYPDFKLGDSATTASTRIEHLLCACTGLPRKDIERYFEFAKATPALTMSELSSTQPTTGFGAAFQYSNALAAAAGFVAGHVVAPAEPLGTAYDRAMQERVFKPLGMVSTTFDYARALQSNHATGHTWSIPTRGRTEVIDPNGLDRGATHAIRPAGGAWSRVDDMIKYVQLELDNGVARDGKRVVSESNLLKRRDEYAMIAEHVHYGIGLVVDRSSGTPVIGHSGRIFGYASEIMWLPEHGVGAVFLSNADAGDILAEAFERYLLELSFDAEPKAQVQLTQRAAFMRGQLTDLLAQVAIPAEPRAADALAAHYVNEKLGKLDVERKVGATTFDFGEWKSEVASRIHGDGSISFMTITAGFDIFEFVASRASDGKRALVLRDAQHEYAFVETN
jgi:CubicO group peptidase (beta-lactamase class C family)